MKMPESNGKALAVFDDAELDVSKAKWISVVIEGCETTLSLTEVLIRAHEITSLAISDPLAHGAVMRVLTAMTALLVREFGHKGVEDVKVNWVDSRTVENVMSRFADKWRLDHPVYPFAQEWAATTDGMRATSANVVDMSTHIGGLFDARPDVPRSTAKNWRTLRTSSLSLKDIVHTVLVHWFCSVASGGRNKNGAHPLQSASMGLRNGNDAQFFWRGPNLAVSLLANTPTAWVLGKGLPAFLNRDGRLGSANHQLTKGTHAINAILLTWAKLPTQTALTGLYMAGSRYSIRGRTVTPPTVANAPSAFREPKRLKGESAKDYAARTSLAREEHERKAEEFRQGREAKTSNLSLVYAARSRDPFRSQKATLSEKEQAESDKLRRKGWDPYMFANPVSPGSASFDSLAEWNSAAAARFREERAGVLVVGDTSEWAVEVLSTTVLTTNNQPSVASAEWSSFDPRILTMRGSAAEAFASLAADVDTIRKQSRTIIAKTFNPGREETSDATKKKLNEFEKAFNAQCDEIAHRFASMVTNDDTGRADEMDMARRAIFKSMELAFDRTIAPYERDLGLSKFSHCRGRVLASSWRTLWPKDLS